VQQQQQLSLFVYFIPFFLSFSPVIAISLGSYIFLPHHTLVLHGPAAAYEAKPQSRNV
jgi:hypothetical protein